MSICKAIGLIMVVSSTAILLALSIIHAEKGDYLHGIYNLVLIMTLLSLFKESY